MFSHNLLKNLKKFWYKHWKGIILFSIAVILFLIPQLFWGSLYQVGGDDTRLYYIYPWEFLKNYSFNVISNNSLGVSPFYGPVSYSSPFLFFILFLKKFIPIIQTQLLLYSLNLSLGFVSFYLFLDLWRLSKRNIVFIGQVVASLTYVLSIFLIKTLYSYQLLSMYLITIVPIFFFLYIKSVRESKIYLIIIAALIYSIFSSTILTFPWFFPMCIILIPLFVYMLLQYRKRFIIYSAVLLICLILLNFYWEIHLLYPLIHKTGTIDTLTYFSSSNFKNSNISLIEALSNLNNPINQFFYYVRTSWGEVEKNNLSFVLNGVFFLVIITAAIQIKTINEITKKYFLLALTILVVTFFFFSPNLGNWNLQAFLLLNNKVPFFSSLRNMYDKFSLAMAFSYSYSLFLAFEILGQTYKKRIFKYLLYLLIFIILLTVIVNSFNFLLPKSENKSFSTSISGTFNKPFRDLVAFMKKNNDGSSAIWFPLNDANYIAIRETENHFYFGPSPLQLLSSRTDYTGFSALDTPLFPNRGEILYTLLKSRSYNKLLSLLSEMGIKYIIVNSDQFPKAANAFLYNGHNLKTQQDFIKSGILGASVKNFGNLYQIYKIPDEFNSSKISLSNNTDDLSSLTYKKINSSLYEIHLNNIGNNQSLIFKDPYNNGWNLYFEYNGKKLSLGESKITLHYANGWGLNKLTNYKKTSSLNLLLYFGPSSLTKWGISVSILTFFVSILAIYLNMRRISLKK